MRRIEISKVGGLNGLVLAKMRAYGRLAVLTTHNTPHAVVLPYTDNENAARQAASQYRSLMLGDGHIKVNRFTKRTRRELAEAGSLVVYKRGEPKAILLPPPANQEQAEKGARFYLEALKII